MLGENIGETSGKITSQRVLRNLGGSPKMETSFQASGSILGTDVKETGTYCTVVRPDGTLYGEGQGVMVTKDGEMATWTANGVGTTNKDGTARFSGAVYYQTYPRQMVPLEQRHGRIRIRSRRRRQHKLRFLGMEITGAIA
jgi:hypothetical protein